MNSALKFSLFFVLCCASGLTVAAAQLLYSGNGVSSKPTPTPTPISTAASKTEVDDSVVEPVIEDEEVEIKKPQPTQTPKVNDSKPVKVAVKVVKPTKTVIKVTPTVKPTETPKVETPKTPIVKVVKEVEVEPMLEKNSIDGATYKEYSFSDGTKLHLVGTNKGETTEYTLHMKKGKKFPKGRNIQIVSSTEETIPLKNQIRGDIISLDSDDIQSGKTLQFENGLHVGISFHPKVVKESIPEVKNTPEPMKDGSKI
jgi:hypothetical protein